jgi:REP element-mobilizing transposase RayT
MPRRLRDDYEGAWHHVMNRGIDHARIFDDVAARVFLLELRDACGRHGVQVHGYCILPNHYHLLLCTPKAGLSDAMQSLSSRFTQSVNRHRERDGPLFKGRFRSVEIKDGAHLARVSQYIHVNPVEAGLVAKPEDWRWSSAGAYLGVADKPEWLRTDTVLEMFGPADSVSAYAQYLLDGRERGQTPRSRRWSLTQTSSRGV